MRASSAMSSSTRLTADVCAFAVLSNQLLDSRAFVSVSREKEKEEKKGGREEEKYKRLFSCRAVREKSYLLQIASAREYLSLQKNASRNSSRTRGFLRKK